MFTQWCVVRQRMWGDGKKREGVGDGAWVGAAGGCFKAKGRMEQAEEKACGLQQCCKGVAVSAEQSIPCHLLSWGSCHEATRPVQAWLSSWHVAVKSRQWLFLVGPAPGVAAAMGIVFSSALGCPASTAKRLQDMERDRR